MSEPALSILAGRTAYERLQQEGWAPEKFTTLIGASGGAKLLGLAHLDRYLFGEYLQRSDHAMELYGSSIGSWRHAALAAPDPLSAVIELQERYLNQRWDEDDRRSPGEIVDALCDWVLDGVCTEAQRHHLLTHPRFTTHIVTARGLGLNNRPRGATLAVGMGLAAFRNAISRRQLAKGFQRVVFSSGQAMSFSFSDFDTLHVGLSADSIKPALLASGSIPFLMSGQRDLPGAPRGHYWDGGIIDYHFDFANHAGEGLALYPHFSEKAIIGWFDKPLRHRVNSASVLDRTVILAPSPTYLARLPHGKIPDRKDFSRLSQADRMTYWQTAVDMSRELADAFAEVVDSPAALHRVTRLG